MKLWLDDVRPAPDDTWTIARTADEAIAAIKACPPPEFEMADLDHDLGHCDKCEGCVGWKDPCGCRCHLTGYIVAVWMETEGRWPLRRPRSHSANPVGRAKIEAAIAREWEIRAARGGA